MTTRSRIAAACLPVLLAVVASCGTDDGDSGATTTTAQADDTTTSAADASTTSTTDPPTITSSAPDGTGESATIRVESPVAGETVTSPLTVTGSSATFEGNVLISVTDSSGTVVYDSFFTSTGANDNWGPFEETIEFDAAPGPATLTLWESDVASDDPGARRNVVEIPVEIG
ncbi:MAG: Gmad2 immunoglobulin-like domain-containing protein [Acidimicrobiia bacterium]